MRLLRVEVELETTLLIAPKNAHGCEKEEDDDDDDSYRPTRSVIACPTSPFVLMNSKLKLIPKERMLVRYSQINK